jgi:hypothetical protein
VKWMTPVLITMVVEYSIHSLFFRI